jgi:hypothetical protein
MTAPSTSRLCGPASAPLLGDVYDVHIELRPEHLPAMLDPPLDEACLRRRRRHEVMMVAEPRGGAVVEHHTVVSEHHSVTATADRQRGPAIDVDAFEEFSDVASEKLEFAERRHIDESNAVASRARLAPRGVVETLA